MFQIFILYINLDIQIGFFRYFSGLWVFGLSTRVQLITLRIHIYFVTPYKIHLVFFLTFQTRYGSGFSVRIRFRLRILCPALNLIYTLYKFCMLNLIFNWTPQKTHLEWSIFGLDRVQFAF